VLTQADFLSLHVPLLPATLHMLNAETLNKMQAHAVLINTSRGGIIDESALLAALTAGRPRLAILDVRELEPPPADDPLLTCPSVLLTPHIAGLTAQAQERTSRLVVSDVLRVLAGEPAIGRIS